MKRFTGFPRARGRIRGTPIQVLTVTLDGLMADTRYEVWVRAVNAEGVGPWSALATPRRRRHPRRA